MERQELPTPGFITVPWPGSKQVASQMGGEFSLGVSLNIVYCRPRKDPHCSAWRGLPEHTCFHLNQRKSWFRCAALNTVPCCSCWGSVA